MASWLDTNNGDFGFPVVDTTQQQMPPPDAAPQFPGPPSAPQVPTALLQGGAPQVPPQSAPAGNKGGLSIGDYIALAIEGFASGATGKAPQGAKIIQQRQQAELQQKALQLQQIQEIPKAINLLQEMRDNLKDETKATMAPKIAQHLKDALGADYFTPEVVNEFLAPGSSALNDFKNGFEFVKLLPETSQRNIFNVWKKNPAAAEKQISDMALNVATQLISSGKEVPDPIKNALYGESRKKFDERSGEMAFNKIIAASEGVPPEKLKDVTLQQLDKTYPGANSMTDQQKMDLNSAGYSQIKTKNLMEAESKAKIESVATQAANERAAMREENINARHLETTNRMMQQFAETNAIAREHLRLSQEAGNRAQEKQASNYFVYNPTTKMVEPAEQGNPNAKYVNPKEAEFLRRVEPAQMALGQLKGIIERVNKIPTGVLQDIVNTKGGEGTLMSRTVQEQVTKKYGEQVAADVALFDHWKTQLATHYDSAVMGARGAGNIQMLELQRAKLPTLLDMPKIRMEKANAVETIMQSTVGQVVKRAGGPTPTTPPNASGSQSGGNKDQRLKNIFGD